MKTPNTSVTPTQTADKDSGTCGSNANTQGKSREQTGHTPGPWFINAGSTNGRRDHQIYSDHQNRTIIADCIHKDNQPATEVDANARLIAAAPELLEACKKALAFEPEILCFSDSAYGRIFKQIRKAIAKAEGKTNE